MILTEIFQLLGTIAVNNSDANAAIEDTTGKVNTFSEKLTNGINTVGKWALGIGAAAGTVSTVLTKVATSAAGTADNIDKMSQKIGISREAYQELDFVCSQSGTSVDTLQMGIKTLTNQMQSAADGTETAVKMFDKLGVSIYDSNGSLKEQETMMWETMQALQNMENQTEKAALATDLLGRSGSELMPLLNGASGSINEMRQQAHDLGLILDDELIDNGVELTDTMDQMKRSLSAVGTEVGGDLMPIVKKGCEYVIKKIPDIRNLVEKLKPSLKKILAAVEPIFEAVVEKLLPEIIEIASKTLPALSEVLLFCVDHFGEFAGIIVTVVGVLKTMSIISSVTTAVQGASGAFGTFNAVLSANPIGAVVTALALLAGGVALLVSSLEDEQTATEKVREENEKNLQSLKDQNQAIQDNRDAIDEKATAELAETEYIEGLWKELQTLCDESGNVEEADRSRADFIINQLNDALGTEIEFTDGQIQNYKDLQEEIYNTIDAKKAQILFNANEEKYTQAIQERAAAEEALANKMKEVAAQQKKCNDLHEEYNQKLSDYQNERMSRSDWEEYNDMLNSEQEKLKGLHNEYSELNTRVTSYYTDISRYEEAASLMAQEKYSEAYELMESYNAMYLRAADISGEATQEQIKQLKQQVIDAGIQRDILKNQMEECAENEKSMYERMYENAVKHFEDMKGELEKAGGEYSSSLETGIKGTVSSVYNTAENSGIEMAKKFAKGAAALIDFVSSNGKTIGQQFANGVSTGVSEGQEAFKNSLGNFLNNGVNFIKALAGIHSPSRLFADEVGAFIPSGVGAGIEDNEEDAIKPLRSMIGNMASFSNADVNNYSTQNNSSIINSNVDNSALLSEIRDLVDTVKNMKIYLNGDTLVGEIAPAMDEALGERAVDSERGR